MSAGKSDGGPQIILGCWSRDPLGAEIVNGRIYGRGAGDMKTGVAAVVAAARGGRGVRDAATG